MDTHRVRPYGFEEFLAQNHEFVASVHEEVRVRGPLTADDLSVPDGTRSRIPGVWHGSVTRAVLESHFGADAWRSPIDGRTSRGLTISRNGFSLRNTMADRWNRADAQRELLGQAAAACGIAVIADLADYYRVPIREARPRIAELVETGDLREVKVEGWREPGYLHGTAACRRRSRAEPCSRRSTRRSGFGRATSAVPVRLPRGDLRGRAEAVVGLLRLAFSVGRSPGRPRRPQGRSEGSPPVRPSRSSRVTRQARHRRRAAGD